MLAPAADRTASDTGTAHGSNGDRVLPSKPERAIKGHPACAPYVISEAPYSIAVFAAVRIEGYMLKVVRHNHGARSEVERKLAYPLLVHVRI